MNLTALKSKAFYFGHGDHITDDWTYHFNGLALKTNAFTWIVIYLPVFHWRTKLKRITLINQ